MSASAPRRLSYSAGALLSAGDFTLEQAYELAGTRTLSSGLHTAGVVGGLVLEVGADQTTLSVTPGCALDAAGRLLRLDRVTAVPIAKRSELALYVTLAYGEELSDPAPGECGCLPGRIREAPLITVSGAAPADPSSAIVLGVIRFASDRTIAAVELDARVHAGARVGALSFPPPGALFATAPEIAHGRAANALVVTSPQTTLFGDLRVGDAFAIGSTGAAPRAAIDVTGTPWLLGTGTITSHGTYVQGANTSMSGQLAVGDELSVATAAGGNGEAQTVQAIMSPELLTVAEPFVSDIAVPSSFTFRQSLVARFSLGNGQPALAVTATGNVGIGTSAPQARLHIAGGALALDAKRALRFGGDGTVSAGDATAHAIRFRASANVLELVEQGDIYFSPGATTGQETAKMVVRANGRVGIGTKTPQQPLTVAGTIIARGGLVFPDGTKQTQAVVPIPIGTIVDWWRPDGSLAVGPEGFQVCNGATVTDPASPLVGLQLPDLSDRFVRAVVEQVGATGGAASHKHSFQVASHRHSISHVHRVKGAVDQSDQGQGTKLAGSDNSKVTHTHAVDDWSGGPSPATSGASIGGVPVDTTTADNLPPYMYLLKIMRIK